MKKREMSNEELKVRTSECVDFRRNDRRAKRWMKGNQQLVLLGSERRRVMGRSRWFVACFRARFGRGEQLGPCGVARLLKRANSRENSGVSEWVARVYTVVAIEKLNECIGPISGINVGTQIRAYTLAATLSPPMSIIRVH